MRVRIAVTSDLHYDRVVPGEPCRPSVARAGLADDPMWSLLELAKTPALALSALQDDLRVDYLLCPGDITNRASAEGFREGWARIRELQSALGARHVLATTGNHEVSSRAESADNQRGNSERAIDPLAVLQQHIDFPTTAFPDELSRWVYWGRGYHFVEQPDVLFLIINSSHFHPTTRDNEFERGRIGDVALQLLREELLVRVSANRNRAFVALMHHHPVQHQVSGMGDDRIDMYNGPALMEYLEATDVTWLVVHGHKHHGRLIQAQGNIASPIVFAAGTFGAFLSGDFATRTKQQFYILEIDVVDQSVSPGISCHVRAFSWSGSDWRPNNTRRFGLPDRCGHRVPTQDMRSLAARIKAELDGTTQPFLTWEEIIQRVPDARYIRPLDANVLERALHAHAVNVNKAPEQWFPIEVSK